MSHSLIWVAIRGKSPEQVCQDFALRNTGRREDDPASPITSAILSKRWFLVISNNFDDTFISDPLLAKVSQACELISFAIDERANFSAAIYWNNTRKRWGIFCTGGKPIKFLGQLPTFPEAIRSRLTAPQSEVSIVADVAHAICGYRHDKPISSPDGAPAFEVLSKLPPPAKKLSLFRRIFK